MEAEPIIFLEFYTKGVGTGQSTTIIDLAKALSEKQRLDLETSLNSYEQETGWKIRVLSQYEKTPGLAVKDYWGLYETSLLIVADPRGGNLLSFNVGDAYFASILPCMDRGASLIIALSFQCHCQIHCGNLARNEINPKS